MRAILGAFAQRTGLEGAGSVPRRYLWTDAFAVCAFVEFARATAEREPLDSALRLVEQVHATLGRHRADDARRGWISGLDEARGREHPTAGGLRIGKPLPERSAGEPFDERLEWERDGQYFHYLTKWMHALACVARAGAGNRHLRWAIELARAAHAGFVQAVPGSARKRMVWKASIDLARPLVPSMGAHDPLDGLLTLRGLRADARRRGWSAADIDLDVPIDDLRSMCRGVDWATDDALGIGGLLWDAGRLAQQLPEDGADAELLPAMLEGALAGLVQLARGGAFGEPAQRRLAFRELGLAIGLHALPRLARLVERDLHGGRERRALEALHTFLPLAAALEDFWSDPVQQRAATWSAHLDINAVMLATSLMPESFLSA